MGKRWAGDRWRCLYPLRWIRSADCGPNVDCTTRRRRRHHDQQHPNLGLLSGYVPSCCSGQVRTYTLRMLQRKVLSFFFPFLHLFSCSKQVQNHIGSVHACGMALAAESATGILIGMNVPDDRLPLCKRMAVDFTRRSQGSHHSAFELGARFFVTCCFCFSPLVCCFSWLLLIAAAASAAAAAAAAAAAVACASPCSSQIPMCWPWKPNPNLKTRSRWHHGRGHAKRRPAGRCPGAREGGGQCTGKPGKRMLTQRYIEKPNVDLSADVHC